MNYDVRKRTLALPYYLVNHKRHRHTTYNNAVEQIDIARGDETRLNSIYAQVLISGG